MAGIDYAVWQARGRPPPVVAGAVVVAGVGLPAAVARHGSSLRIDGRVAPWRTGTKPRA